jgi:cellulose synthase/poly-beta-1,6-N-acetylglucosamine synthase-like glycosyltransferase
LEQYLLYLATGITIALGCLAAAQTCYVWLYARGSEADGLKIHPLPGCAPKTAVLVCLRGRDPSLVDSLHALASQTHTNFEIHLAFDSQDDPAVGPARIFAAVCERPVKMHFLPKPTGNCGLKCDLQRHVIQLLASDVEIVVFMDGDGIAPPEWLQRITQPLFRKEVGAVSGNRWFESAPGWGTQIRRYWNAAAIVQMYLYRIPWGGALALRKETIETADLLDVWRTTLCEDTVVKQVLQPLGLQIVYLPRLVFTSRETTNVSSAANWIARQLLTARLYHPSWWLVAGHSLIVGASVVASFICIAIAIAAGAWLAAGIVMAAFVLYQLCNLTILDWIESNTIESSLESAGKQKEPGGMLRLVLITMTQLIHCWAAIRAATLQAITWRGIRYRIAGRRIEMLEYHPFQHSTGSGQSIF